MIILNFMCLITRERTTMISKRIDSFIENSARDGKDLVFLYRAGKFFGGLLGLLFLFLFIGSFLGKADEIKQSISSDEKDEIKIVCVSGDCAF